MRQPLHLVARLIPAPDAILADDIAAQLGLVVRGHEGDILDAPLSTGTAPGPTLDLVSEDAAFQNDGAEMSALAIYPHAMVWMDHEGSPSIAASSSAPFDDVSKASHGDVRQPRPARTRHNAHVSFVARDIDRPWVFSYPRRMFTCLAALCITGAVAIDGDTLRLDSPGQNLRLRIWGIDAPEIKDTGGVEASRALARLVADKTLACDLMDVDRYGRPVVRCQTDQTPDIACEMVRQGHAVDWQRYSKGRYREC